MDEPAILPAGARGLFDDFFLFWLSEMHLNLIWCSQDHPSLQKTAHFLAMIE
jgi:hypothetical protein